MRSSSFALFCLTFTFIAGSANAARVLIRDNKGDIIFSEHVKNARTQTVEKVSFEAFADGEKDGRIKVVRDGSYVKSINSLGEDTKVIEDPVTKEKTTYYLGWCVRLNGRPVKDLTQKIIRPYSNVLWYYGAVKGKDGKTFEGCSPTWKMNLR